MNKSNKLIYGILLSAFFFFISPSLYSSPNGKIPTSPAKTKVTKTIALEGGDYSSIDEAMSDIAEFGIADTLVLQLLDNSYSIFSFNINPAGPNRGTLIFESGSSDTINIEFESPGKSSSNNTLGGANGLYVYSDFLRSLKFIRVKLVASQFMSTLTSVVMEGAKVDFSLSGLQATGTEFNSPAGLDVYSLSDSCSFSFDNCTFTDVGSAGYTYGEYPYELTMTNCNFSFSYAGMWCENVGGNSFFENNIFRGDGIEGNGLTVYSSNSSVLGISDNEFDITSSGAIYVGFSSASPAKNLSGSHISSAKSSREKFRDNISQRKQQMKESRISRKQHSSTERTERVTALLTQPRTKHNLTRHPNAKELPTLNISNNTILNSGTDGIYVEYVENGDVVINGNSIQGNSFTGNGIYLPYFSGFGDNAPTVSVENNTISGFGNGMYTDGSEYAGDVSFSKNTIHGYGSIALELNDWTAFSMQVDSNLTSYIGGGDKQNLKSNPHLPNKSQGSAIVFNFNYGGGEQEFYTPVSVSGNELHLASAGISSDNISTPGAVNVLGNTVDSAEVGIYFFEIIAGEVNINNNIINKYQGVGLNLDYYYPSNWENSGSISFNANSLISDIEWGSPELGIYLGSLYGTASITVDNNDINGSTVGTAIYTDEIYGWSSEAKSPDKHLRLTLAEKRERIKKSTLQSKERNALILSQKGTHSAQPLFGRKSGAHNTIAEYKTSISFSNNDIELQTIYDYALHLNGTYDLASADLNGNTITNISDEVWGYWGIHSYFENVLNGLVNGNTLTGLSNGVGVDFYSYGSEVETNDFVLDVSGNEIHSHDAGISVYSENYGSQNTIQVQENSLFGEYIVGGGKQKGESGGLDVYTATYNDGFDISPAAVVSGNTVEQFGYAMSVSCYGYETAEVINNTLAGNYSGLYVDVDQSTSKTLIEGNTSTNNEGDGGYISTYFYPENPPKRKQGSPEISVIQNTFSENGTGVTIAAFGDADAAGIVFVTGNTVSDNLNDGIVLMLNNPSGEAVDTVPSSIEATVDFNHLVGNGGAGLTILNATNPPVTLTHNNMFDNEGFDVFLPVAFEETATNYWLRTSSVDVNAQNNYWGETTTLEMQTNPYPSNISEIRDELDNEDLGFVEYNNWIQDSIPPSSSGLVSGIVFSDADGDGVKGETESGIEDWTVYVNGVRADSAVTDSTGYYEVYLGDEGEYTLSQVLPNGWRQTFPANNETYSIEHTEGNSYPDKNFGNNLDTTKFRTITASTQLSLKPIKLKKGKDGKYPLPNIANVRDTIVKANAGITVGRAQTKDSLKFYSWAYWKKGADLGKFYTAEHTPPSYPFDSIRNLKTPSKKPTPMKKAYKADRKKYKNPLVAEMAVLKLNLAGSQRGVFPFGLSTLKLYTPTGDYVAYDGMLLGTLASQLDSALTYWKRYSLLRDTTTANSLANLIKMINESFADSINDSTEDLKSLSTFLRLNGVKKISDVSFLRRDPTAKDNWNWAANGENDYTPESFTLHQNYPNPFNPTTTISFVLPEAAVISLKIYDVLGREVVSVINKEEWEEGEHHVQFNAANISSGVYFYRLTSLWEEGKSFTQSKKLMLIK